jgi:hypothetical protein
VGWGRAFLAPRAPGEPASLCTGKNTEYNFGEAALQEWWILRGWEPEVFFGEREAKRRDWAMHRVPPSRFAIHSAADCMPLPLAGESTAQETPARSPGEASRFFPSEALQARPKVC